LTDFSLEEITGLKILISDFQFSLEAETTKGRGGLGKKINCGGEEVVQYLSYYINI
jgi:hypothetical protein